MVAVAPDRRSAQLWSGGHPAPFLLGPRPEHLLLDEQGPALGLLPGGTWEPTRVDLPPAWRLLLFTDGLVEGHTGDGVDRLGTEGLEPLLARVWGAAAEDAGRSGALGAPGDAERLDELLAEVTALNRGPLSDDVAALVVGASAGEVL
jgi:serine phosphatase RsbU (regulator of sigma subunit)